MAGRIKQILKKSLKKTGLFGVAVKVYDSYIYRRNFSKTIKQIRRISSETEIVFFFSFYCTGGAEKVHFQITELVKEKKTVTFFTGRSFNEHYKSKFEGVTQCLELIDFIKNEDRFRKRMIHAIVNKLNSI